MSRDNDTQFYGLGLLPDTGTVTLGTSGTATVYTRLSKVLSAVACHQAPVVASALICGTLSSGAITITDPAGALNYGKTVSYTFLGWP